jgi:WD40 repeat protein
MKVKLSPAGNWIATAEAKTLKVFELRSQEVVSSFSCVDVVESISWAPDSSLVLVTVPKRSTVQVPFDERERYKKKG